VRKAIAIRFEKKDREPPQPPLAPFDACPYNVTKIASVDTVEAIPPPLHYQHTVPEICIIGRSNVGKSTLVNALLGFNSSFVQKCTVSDKPGETRRLDFYAVGKRRVNLSELPKDASKVVTGEADMVPKAYIKVPDIVLVDLPGYSFSFLPPSVIENLEKLTMSFLMGRGKSLKRVILLLDARHGFKYADKAFFDKLKATIADIRSRLPSDEEFKIHWKLQICLTKADLVERTDLARRIQVVNDSLSEWLPTSGDIDCGNLSVMVVSGLERKGISELQREIAVVMPALETPKPVEVKPQESIVRFSKLGGNSVWDSKSRTKGGGRAEGGISKKDSTATPNRPRSLSPSVSNVTNKVTAPPKNNKSTSKDASTVPVTKVEEASLKKGRVLLRSKSRKQKR